MTPSYINSSLYPVVASVVFGKSEGNVGEPLQAQLLISSCAKKGSSPIKLSQVKLVFEGCLRPVKLQSDQNQDSDTTTRSCISSIPLREPSSVEDSGLQSPTGGLATLVGIADLTIGPSQTKVYNLTCIPRESGEAQVASIAMILEEEKFDLTYVITEQHSRESFWWQETQKGPTRRRIGKDRDTGKCKILPKPPKIRISTPNLRNLYYTNERVALKIGIHNEEDEAVDVSAEVRLFGPQDSTTKLEWLEGDSVNEALGSGMSSPNPGPTHFIKRSVGAMERAADRDLTVVLGDTQEAAKHTLEITALYHLVSDIQTPIVKTITVELSFTRPFEANYEFLPRVHTKPWPNFFAVDDKLAVDDSTAPGGLLQRWCLNSKLVSFAKEPLIIDNMSLKLLSLSGGAVCNIDPETLVSPETPQIAAEELRESNFCLDLQKLTLGDRRPSAVNFALEISWYRASAETNNENDLTTTILEVPRFMVPMGEPRVLASASASTTMSGLYHLEYTIENPSTHFLTFNLIMEASEFFAFSGPKTTVVQLVPLSRHTVRYNLLAAKRGLWVQPQLVVVDTYFNKTLRVLPTGDMRSDKKGILMWVDAED